MRLYETPKYIYIIRGEKYTRIIYKHRCSVSTSYELNKNLVFMHYNTGIMQAVEQFVVKCKNQVIHYI